MGINRKYPRPSLLFFIHLLFLWLVLFKINLNIVHAEGKHTVTIMPLVSSANLWYLNVNPGYPAVSLKTGSFAYFYNDYLETINNKDVLFTNLTDAAKRIVELENWDGETPIIGGINNVNELKSWWEKRKPGLLKFYKFRNYAGWEASLGRYLISWQKEIENVDPEKTNIDIMNLKGHLRKYQQKMWWLVYNSKRSLKEKKYLFNLINKIHSYLGSELNRYIPDYDLANIHYSLSALQKDKQSDGIYDIRLRTDTILFLPDAMPSLTVGDKIIAGEPVSDKTIGFKNVIIDDKVGKLTLHVIMNSPKNNRWRETFDKTTNSYRYSLILPDLDYGPTYFMNLTYRFKQKINLQLIGKANLPDSETEQILYNEDLLPFKEQSVIKTPFAFSKENGPVRGYYLLLTASQPLSSQEMKSVSVDFQPFLDPEIIMEKVGNLVRPAADYQKTGSLKSIGWGIAGLLCLSLLGLFVFKYKQQFHKFVFLPLSAIILKLRFIFFILFFLSLFVYFCVFYKINNSVLIWTAVFWFTCLISYRFKTQITNIFALLFLNACLLSIFYEDSILTEKTATITYLFLAVGAFQSLLEFKTTEETEKKNEKHVNRISKWPFLKSLYGITYLLIGKLILKIEHFYIASRTKKDISRSIFRFGMTVAAIVGFIIVYSNISHLIDRGKLDPVIVKIEPKIVYQQNKAIIKGRNFGWQDNQGGTLISQYGPVTVSLWTDTKLIFSVPLDWKPGTITLWIEKPSSWDSKKITVKSKAVSIKLIPIKNSMDKEDDEYFEQLKHLDKETLELNGYK